MIIVLGRGINADDRLTADSKARVEKAVELFHNGAARYMIMSGGYSFHLAAAPQVLECTAMSDYAVSLGAPVQRIVQEADSKDTIGNMYFTKKLCQQKGWNDIIIVSSEDHVKRAAYLFKKIYGPQFTVKHHRGQQVLADAAYAEQVAHEAESLAITKKWVDSIADGDDSAIYKLMVSIHPAYKLQGRL